jgi:hypothetical protein
MRRRHDINHSNPNLDPPRGDTVPDSMCNLRLATEEEAMAAWRGCQSAIRKWLGMKPGREK